MIERSLYAVIASIRNEVAGPVHARRNVRSQNLKS